jgi:hypothetical protein
MTLGRGQRRYHGSGPVLRAAPEGEVGDGGGSSVVTHRLFCHCPDRYETSSQTSPYARKVRITIAEKRKRMRGGRGDAKGDGTSVPDHNPRMPVLILDDRDRALRFPRHRRYLDTVSPVRLDPEPSQKRIAVRCLEALG